MEKLTFKMLVKDLKMRTLVTADQQVRLTLESLYAEDVPKLLTELAGLMEVKVTIEKVT